MMRCFLMCVILQMISNNPSRRNIMRRAAVYDQRRFLPTTGSMLGTRDMELGLCFENLADVNYLFQNGVMARVLPDVADIIAKSSSGQSGTARVVDFVIHVCNEYSARSRLRNHSATT